MRILYWLYLLIKRQIKNPVIIAFIILMPVMALIITNVPDLNKKEKPRVGIVVEDDDEIALRTRNYLVEGDYSVEFYDVPSEKQLEKDIYDNGTECGYVIGSNLSGKLESGKYHGAIELVMCNSNFISSMTNEIFFAAMFKAYSPEIAINYIRSVKEFQKHADKAQEDINKGYQEYIDGNDTFRIDFRILDDTDISVTRELEDSTGEFPIKPVLVILVYIAGLFGIVQFYMDAEKGTFITLSKVYRIAGKPLYAFIGSFLFAVSVEITLAITGDVHSIKDVCSMAVYVLAVTAFSWALATIVRTSTGMIIIMPVLVIACVILCPVFINIVAYVPFLKYLRALLIPWYMM